MSSRHLQRRCQSVEMEPMDDCSENSNQTWLQEGLNSMQLKRSEMNELIMDYLIHEGFKEAAERFRFEAGIEPNNLKFSSSNQTQETNIASNNSVKVEQQHQQLDQTEPMTEDVNDAINTQPNEWLKKSETSEMMDKRIEVRNLIEEGDILKAQSSINLYYPELLDNHKELYFKLQQQHLIELIRKQKIDEVLTFVHDQLSVDELRDLTEMERTLALLAYEYPDKSPYAGLLEISHRLQLASEINDIILQETTGSIEPSKPRLVTLLKLLFWTQNELEKKKIPFPKMTDLVEGTIIEPRH